MVAAVLHSIADLRVEDVPKPVPADGEVLVHIRYCGICGSDIPRIFQKGTYHFPTIPGHEMTGTVEYDPTGEMTGMCVTVFPLIPCFSCPSCKAEEYAACSHYDYYGSRRDGGFAEYLAVKRWNLVPLPEHVSTKVGAMCEPIAVARHAALRAGIRKDDRVLITGAGPIGIFTGLWAKSLGAQQVYYDDIDPRKTEFAKSMGFDIYTEGTPIDTALEGTGVSGALIRVLAAVKPFGHVVLLGNPPCEVTLPQEAYWHIMRKELTVCGTWNSSFGTQKNDWRDALAALDNGTIRAGKLITHIYPLTKTAEALKMITGKAEFYSKVLLDCEV